MPIKILLSVALAGLLAYTAIQRVAPRFLKLLIFSLVLLGTWFVWVPEHTTAVANYLGVGRGTDLLIYLWIVLSFAIGLNLHFKVRAARHDITRLTRAIALMSEAPSHGHVEADPPESGSRPASAGDP